MFEGRKVYDVTFNIKNGMTVWPGDAGVTVGRSLSIKEGEVANVSRMELGVHAGTHMDAPLHFIDGGKDMASLDINRFFGKALVVCSDSEEIGEEVFEGHDLKGFKAVFFKTRSSGRDENTPAWDVYPAINEACARYMINRGILTVGIDYMSIELSRDNRFPVHRLLLGNEVAIVESLCLKDIEPGEYDYICLPMKIAGADGSPARVLLIK